MLNLVNQLHELDAAEKAAVEVIVTDGSIMKRCLLLQENRESESNKLTSIVVKSLMTGESRKFNHYDDELREEQPLPTCRQFHVKAVYSRRDTVRKPQKNGQHHPTRKGKHHNSQRVGKRRS